MAKGSYSKKTVESLRHDEAKRKNIPTAEYQLVVQEEERKPATVKYPRKVAGLEKVSSSVRWP